ncbi:unnamed protein product [Clonostachys solani]|uniref:Xylanolytic transcriptional activator regulatory domain-containing protein n=1 Tax=Clonostachys solani TaxID=160281 RepID=A0A9N9ZBQ4_9HYPO|nr:unnamed protein product [Clonostachys solani]
MASQKNPPDTDPISPKPSARKTNTALLNQLKRKAELVERDSSPSSRKRQQKEPNDIRNCEQSNESNDERGEDALPRMRNPLTTTAAKFVTDPQGRRRSIVFGAGHTADRSYDIGFLGPSSTWAYGRQVMGMIREYLNQDESPLVPLNTDGQALPLEFPSEKQLGGTILMDNLPSLDYAIYLTNTVKFHISQTYHLFDEHSFLNGLFSLYNDGPRPLNGKTRLWYVQYFIIMAFGKALLVRGQSASNPPGGGYFMRAMEIFPDVDGLYQDAILAIEICCGLALYLQSIDHRNSAYTYLGLGLRIALSQGLHRDPGGENRDHREAVRERSAWWTLYILDRKFSSLMGAPNSLHDEDISVPFPQPARSIQKSTTLEMHVKLSRLIAKVLNTVYGVDGRLDSSFLRNVQNMLRQLATLGEELNASVELDLNSSNPLSRVSATINLCYHQCIVLATRPLLMCLLRDKLETRSRGGKTHREIVGPVKALLKASCDSATKSLRILSALYSQDLLETFLPFDLDHAFSASFVLSLVSAIQPFPNTIGDSYMETTTMLLDSLTASGNVSARFRQEELQRLHDMLLLVSQDPDQANALEQDTSGVVNVPLMLQGVSPNQMLSVASLLETYPGFDVSPDAAENRWLWEGEMPEFSYE